MIFTENTQFKSWTPINDAEFENGACGKKCHPQLAMQEFNGYTVWGCCHGVWWLNESQPLDVATLGPLMVGDNLQMFLSLHNGGPNMTWGDLVLDEERAARAAETPQQKAKRLEAEAAADRQSHKEVVNFLVHRKEEKWTKNGEMKFRVPRPCKYATLFEQRICAGCSATVPQGQTHCQAKKGYGVCGQELAGCWNHESTHTCIYIHPDEEQWAAACDGSLCYDRQAQCFHLRGAEPVAENRFVRVVRQDKMAQKAPQKRRY